MKVILNIFKLTINLVMALSLIVGLLSCSSESASQSPAVAPDPNAAGSPSTDNTAKLLERASAWNDLIISISTVNQPEALNNIRGFLEPSVATDENVQKLYNGWNTREYTIIGYQIELIQVNADNQHAEIRYMWNIKNSAGREDRILQYTNWILKDGIWYATLKAS